MGMWLAVNWLIYLFFNHNDIITQWSVRTLKRHPFWEEENKERSCLLLFIYSPFFLLQILLFLLSANTLYWKKKINPSLVGRKWPIALFRCRKKYLNISIPIWNLMTFPKGAPSLEKVILCGVFFCLCLQVLAHYEVFKSTEQVQRSHTNSF